MSVISNVSGFNAKSNKTIIDENPETENELKLKPLENQVGGHDSRKGLQRYTHLELGVYDLGNGRILKALVPPPRGTRELTFYQHIFYSDCGDNSDLLELRSFIPRFYGAQQRDFTTFIKLDNLTAGTKRPCVMDVKMGRVTYDQEADADKICHEQTKFPPAKKTGFQICGLLIQDKHEKKVYEKNYRRSLTEKNILSHGLEVYFSVLKGNAKRQVLQGLITRLKRLEAWFLKQRKYSFIASSLLFIYEGVHGQMMKYLPDPDAEVVCNDSFVNNDAKVPWNSTDTLNLKKTEDKVVKSGHCKQSHGDMADVDRDPMRDEHDNSEGKDWGGLSGSVQQSSPETVNSRDNTGLLLAALPLEDIIPTFSVHLIDFAHVFPTTDVDENFLYGLTNLINHLQQLLV